MFKHYLTYQFAQSFHRLCLTLALPDEAKKIRLVRSAEQMIESFSRAIQSKTLQAEGVAWVATVLNLRDCREMLVAEAAFAGEIATHYEIVEERIEKIAEAVARAQGGQLRMLG